MEAPPTRGSHRRTATLRSQVGHALRRVVWPPLEAAAAVTTLPPAWTVVALPRVAALSRTWSEGSSAALNCPPPVRFRARSALPRCCSETPLKFTEQQASWRRRAAAAAGSGSPLGERSGALLGEVLMLRVANLPFNLQQQPKRGRCRRWPRVEARRSHAHSTVTHIHRHK